MNIGRADRIVALRASREDTLKREVAAAQERVNDARAHLRALRDELAGLRSADPERAPTGHELARAEAYAERLREQIQHHEEALYGAEEELERAQETLTGAAQDRMAAETLREREAEALLVREAAHDQRELDDAAMRLTPWEGR